MYAFGKEYGNRIVRVDVSSDAYHVIAQYPDSYKTYKTTYLFSRLDGVDIHIKEALHALMWIAEGNEFPER